MEALTVYGPGLLFYLFAALALGGAICVVTLRNPMYNALSLLVSFLAVAALFFLRHAEFVGIVQIFVYGGGIMVLFLFVIMLVNLHRLREVRSFVTGSPVAVMVVVALAILFLATFATLALAPGGGDLGALTRVDGEPAGNSEAVAWLLYREYLLPFEIVSLFLLVAMVGAVVLGRKN